GQQQARLIRLWIQLHRLASIFDRFADVAHGEVDLCPQDQGTHCRGPRFEPELQSSDGALELVALQIKGYQNLENGDRLGRILADPFPQQDLIAGTQDTLANRQQDSFDGDFRGCSQKILAGVEQPAGLIKQPGPPRGSGGQKNDLRIVFAYLEALPQVLLSVQ